MSALHSATRLAARGLRVFPVTPDSKRPAFDDWQRVATGNGAVLREWFDAGDNNVGVATSGLLVVDLDTKHGKDGPGEFAEIVETQRMLGHDLPATFTVETASGGRHLYFTAPAGTRVRNSVGAIADGVDVRGEGGLVVGPGSVIDGRPYRAIDASPIAEAPAWLVALAGQKRRRDGDAAKRLVEETDAAVARAKAWIDAQPAGDDPGAGDNRAYVLAAGLFDFGVSHETCLDLMLGWNDRLDDPMDAERIEEKVDSGEVNRDKPIGWRSPDNNLGFEVLEGVSDEAPEAAGDDHDDASDRYTCVRAGEYAATALTHATEPLIDGIFDCGTLAMLYGASGVYKSFLALDWAFHIAAGSPWQGRDVKQGPVVYIAAEGGAGMRKRCAAWFKTHSLGDVPLFIIPEPIDLLHGDGGYKKLVRSIRWVEAQTGAKVLLVVIDTLSRAMAGGDENSPVDMGRMVMAVDALKRKTEAVVLPIHHSGKDATKGGRGWSGMRAGVDTEIEVAKGKDGKSGVVTVKKQKDDEENQAWVFTARIVPIGTSTRGKQVSSVVLDIHEKGTTGLEVESEGDAEASEAKGAELSATDKAHLATLDAVLRATCKEEFTVADVAEWIGLQRRGAAKLIDRFGHLVLPIGKKGPAEAYRRAWPA